MKRENDDDSPYLSGSIFNKIYKDTRFYKVLNDNLIHHNFEYKVGLNIDTGGFNFCEEVNIRMHMWHHGRKFAHVTIPDDARNPY